MHRRLSRFHEVSLLACVLTSETNIHIYTYQSMRAVQSTMGAFKDQGGMAGGGTACNNSSLKGDERLIPLGDVTSFLEQGTPADTRKLM